MFFAYVIDLAYDWHQAGVDITKDVFGYKVFESFLYYYVGLVFDRFFNGEAGSIGKLKKTVRNIAIEINSVL